MSVAKIIMIIIAMILFGIAAILTHTSFELLKTTLKTTGNLIDIGLAAVAGAFNLIAAIIFVLIAVALICIMLEPHV